MKTIAVLACERFNDTGIDVEAGSTIQVEASGRWTDWTIETDADGFERGYLGPAARFRRVANASWFHLCGAIGRSDRATFALGAKASIDAPAAGRLYLFANDLPAMYWNNKGSLRVSVTVSAPATPA